MLIRRGLNCVCLSLSVPRWMNGLDQIPPTFTEIVLWMRLGRSRAGLRTKSIHLKRNELWIGWHS